MIKSSSNDENFLNSPTKSGKVLLLNSTKSSHEEMEYDADKFWSEIPLLTTEETKLRGNPDLSKIAKYGNIFSNFNKPNRYTNSALTYNNQDEKSFVPLTSQSYSQRENNSLLGTPKQHYLKMPINYIDAKDWQSYMELATIRKETANQNVRLGLITNGKLKQGKFKSHKVNRLLNSIYNLYQDYLELSYEYENLYSQFTNKYLSTDSISSEELGHPNSQESSRFLRKRKHKVKDVASSTKNHQRECTLSQNDSLETASTSCQTSPVVGWADSADNPLTDIDYYPNFPQDIAQAFSTPHHVNTKHQNNSLVSEKSTTNSKSKSLKIYDHLVGKNLFGNQSINVMEEKLCSRTVKCHKINLKTGSVGPQCLRNASDDASVKELLNHPNFIFNSIATVLRCAPSKTVNNDNLELINLPIIIDLMLPKIQEKVRQIFDDCAFLNNPLEVMAELRHFNYNKNATVEYFKTTRQLRGSIKDFITNSIDSRCRLVILRCLYRNYHKYNDIEVDPNKILLCSNCSSGVKEVENVLESCLQNENTLRKSQKCDSSDNTDRYSPLKPMSEELGDIVIEKISRSTLTETRKSESRSSRNSFCQTQNDHCHISSGKLHELAESIKRSASVMKQLVKESKIQISYLQKQVSCLLKTLKNNVNLIISLSDKHLISDQNKNRLILLACQVEELKIKLKEEETKRRLTYNLMQEQMGNVRVYCRCRNIPGSENIIEIQGNESIVLPIMPQEKFELDKVFPADMPQNDIYEEFRPLVMSFIDGFNVCFITYGSEASGKTYTLIGGDMEVSEEQGIMQRALKSVLTEQALRSRDWDYQISACLMEIYNDNCIDILSGESGIQLYVDCGMESIYQKLKSVPIKNEGDIEILLQFCRVKRKIAKTALNPSSSRSHLITIIRLQGKSKIHGESIRSFMCLCDLAGFEDIIKAETQSNKTLAKEAGYINKSLTAFNRVFVSLRRQDPNTVCYRDTKLTHLLKPFLTNSGKCALVTTIRTDRQSLSSTQNTLRFGRETRGVSLGKARRQVNIV